VAMVTCVKRPGDHRQRASAGCAALLLLAHVASAAAADAANQTCTLLPGPVRTVVRVIDSETVLLDDNQQVRLIGALAPRSPDLRSDSQPWPPEDNAKAVLRDLVLGKTVELAFANRRADRYGRLLAHMFLEHNGERAWVQGQLLSGGNARAYSLPGGTPCLREMLAHERLARDAHLGLWASGIYGVRSAQDPPALLRLRNTYQIVAGRIAHIAQTKSRTYINFGEDWHTDFTAGVRGGVLRAQPDQATALAALEGKTVEVRGWIEYRNGPYIEITDLDQIAPLDGSSRLPDASPESPSTSSDRSTTPRGEPGPNEKRPVQLRPGALDL
jgi:micrococcal nuclease